MISSPFRHFALRAFWQVDEMPPIAARRSSTDAAADASVESHTADRRRLTAMSPSTHGPDLATTYAMGTAACA